VDPLGGSYFVEQLTDEMEAAAYKYMHTIEAMGGSVSAIEQGYMQNEIANSAYLYQQNIENKSKIIVGVNQFISEDKNKTPVFKIDESIRKIQTDKLIALKSERNSNEVEKCLNKLKQDTLDDINVMPSIINCVENYATLGEIADIFRNIFGEYKG